MQNLDYLFAAYTVIWVFLFGYLVSLHLRQRKIQTELCALLCKDEGGRMKGEKGKKK